MSSHDSRVHTPPDQDALVLFLWASSECCTKEGRLHYLVVSLELFHRGPITTVWTFPKYFGELYPHSLHTKLVAVFAIWLLSNERQKNQSRLYVHSYRFLHPHPILRTVEDSFGRYDRLFNFFIE